MLGSARRCLLVEDEVLIGMMTLMALEDAGFEVVGPIQELPDAIAAAKTGDYELALLDVAIKGGEVFPAADILSSRGVPVVFHTGQAEREEIRAAYPMARLVSKPAREDQLLAAVAEVTAVA